MPFIITGIGVNQKLGVIKATGQDLIGLIASDEDFEKFFRETFDRLFEGLNRYALTLLKDREMALDAVQSVFIKWWEIHKTIEGEQAIKSYLYTAVYRQCLNQIRNEKTKVMHYECYGYELASNSGMLNDDVVFKELDRQIQEAISLLPPQCKIIFRKSRFESKRYAEIANEMNLSVKTVEAQIGKALKILKEQLKEYL